MDTNKKIEVSIRTSENTVKATFELPDDIDIHNFSQAIHNTIPALMRNYKSIIEPKYIVDLEDIEEVVSRLTGVSGDRIKIKSRKREIVVARQICHAMGKIHTKLSLNVIGEYFGGKDHTTVLHSSRIVQDDWLNDKRYGYGPIIEAINKELIELKDTRKRGYEQI